LLRRKFLVRLKAMRPHLLFLPLLFLAMPLAAQDLSNARIEDAMNEAMRRAQEVKAGKAKLDLPVSIPRNPSAADPEKLAKQYGRQFQTPFPQDELLVFVSTSMPEESLKRLARQTKRAGGVLVLRGFKGGLKKGAMQETLRALKPLADAGANIQIDPEAFTRFGITAAPSFVLAAPDEDCAQAQNPQKQCRWSAARLSGDVSLDYALEHWTKNGGRAGDIAQKFLSRLEGNP
jgi:conjugal transfer pilus assembly protein TrbC